MKVIGKTFIIPGNGFHGLPNNNHRAMKTTVEPEMSNNSLSDTCKGSEYRSNVYGDETFGEVKDVIDEVEYDQSDEIKIEWEYDAAYFGEYDGAPVLRTSNDISDYPVTENNDSGM